MPLTLISRQTLSGSAASVTFSSIPQTFQTLVVMVSSRSDRASQLRDALYIQFNSDTGNNYSTRALAGSGSAASSTSNASVSAIFRGDMPASTATSSTFSNQAITIPNYSGSTNKPISVDDVMENNATESWQWLRAGLWASSSAITSIKLFPEIGPNFVANSTFSLYGVS